MSAMDWRLVVDHNAYTDFSVSVSPAVEKAVGRGEAPPTVFLNVFDRDSITIGVNEDPLQVLALDVCAAHGIDVRRRVNGGGAIYAGAGSVFICFYLPTALPNVPQTSREAFPQVLSAVAATLERQYGIPARYRPLNDVEVEGRKLMPTSLKIEDGVLTMRILLNVKPIDSALAAKAIPLPPEKVKDKVHKDFSTRFTWLEREVGRAITDSELVALTRRVTADAFGVTHLGDGALSDAERRYAEDLRQTLTSEDWLFGKSEHVRFADAGPDDVVGRARVKAVGGLISAAVLVRDGVIRRAIVNGDWHPRPTDGVAWLEDTLTDCPATPAAVGARVEAFLARTDVEFAGIEAADLTEALEKALAAAVERPDRPRPRP